MAGRGVTGLMLLGSKVKWKAFYELYIPVDLPFTAQFW